MNNAAKGSDTPGMKQKSTQKYATVSTYPGAMSGMKVVQEKATVLANKVAWIQDPVSLWPRSCIRMMNRSRKVHGTRKKSGPRR